MKDLILLRGIPGSGKSTIGSIITAGHVISADDYFIDDNGDYKFNASKLKKAHSYCQLKCKDKMTIGIPIIVVANTFTQEWEMESYYELANMFDYKVHSLIVENRHDGKNIHNVPEDKIDVMKKRFEIKL